MEMILNEYDMVVGAKFKEGTIQDYVDEDNTYGLIRVQDTTANWFLYNQEDSDALSKSLFNKVIQQEHFIHDDFGEKIVLFNKQGSLNFEALLKKIDEYMDDELGSLL